MAKKKSKSKIFSLGITFVATVSLIILVITSIRSWKSPDEISPNEAYEKILSGAFILDVRQTDEWKSAHIDGAVLIPLNELSNRLNEVPKDREVIIYCRSGKRSNSAKNLLLSSGYHNVMSLRGGINAWIRAKLPIISEKERSVINFLVI